MIKSLPDRMLKGKFIVELKSKSDRIKDLQKNDRMDGEWLSFGWLIDAEEEIVHIYFEGQEKFHKGFDTPLSGEPVLPGFELILSELRV